MDIEEALRKYFNKSELPVLFAGAGVSVHGGLPSWSVYLRMLAAAASEYDEYIKYQIEKAIRDKAYADAASMYLMCREMPESKMFEELQKPLLDFNWEKLRALSNYHSFQSQQLTMIAYYLLPLPKDLVYRLGRLILMTRL